MSGLAYTANETGNLISARGIGTYLKSQNISIDLFTGRIKSRGKVTVNNTFFYNFKYSLPDSWQANFSSLKY